MSSFSIYLPSSELENLKLAAARASMPVSSYARNVLSGAPIPEVFAPPFGREDEPRDCNVSLKLTASEREHLRRGAAACNRSVSAYVRHSALHGEPPASSPNRLTRQTFKQLRGIARNLNQMTERLHAADNQTLRSELFATLPSDIRAARARVLAWLQAYE